MKFYLMIMLLISNFSFSQVDGIKIRLKAINSSNELSFELMEIFPSDRSIDDKPTIVNIVNVDEWVEIQSNTTLTVFVPLGRQFAIRLTDEISKVQQIVEIHATERQGPEHQGIGVELDFENGNNLIHIYYSPDVNNYVFQDEMDENEQ